MTAYESLPTPTFADAKGQVASALEFGLFVVVCDWMLNHRDGRIEHRFQAYSALRQEGIEAALHEYAHGPFGLAFEVNPRELLATGITLTEEKFDPESGAFVMGELTLHRPSA